MDAPVFTTSDILPYVFKKNSSGRQISSFGEFNTLVNINSFGTRGPELRPKTKQVKRILFLGDSFTYGYGVSDADSYPRIVESLLNQNLNSEFIFEVINAGFAGGHSPDSHYVYLFDKIDKLKPDLVVMGFYTGNDITDLSKNEWVKTDKKGLPERITSKRFVIDRTGRRRSAKIYKSPFLYESHLFFYSNSHFYVLFKNSLVNLYDIYLAFRNGPYYSNEWDKQTLLHSQKVKKLLFAANHKLKERNIDFLVLLINSRTQTVDRIWKEYEKIFPRHNLNRSKPNEVIKDLCKKKEIFSLDLYNIFTLRENQEDFYFPIDGHWNEKGHRLAAEEICSFLVKYNLLGEQDL